MSATSPNNDSHTVSHNSLAKNNLVQKAAHMRPSPYTPPSIMTPHFLPHLANDDLAEEAADVSVTSTVGVNQLLGGHLLTQVWGLEVRMKAHRTA